MIGSIIEGPPDNLVNDIMNANKDLQNDDDGVTNEKGFFTDLIFGNANPDDLENFTGIDLSNEDDQIPQTQEESTNELRELLGEDPLPQEAEDYHKASQDLMQDGGSIAKNDEMTDEEIDKELRDLGEGDSISQREADIIDKELQNLGDDAIAEDGGSLDLMKEMFGEDVNNDGIDAAKANGDSLDVMKEMFGEDIINDGDDAAQADLAEEDVMNKLFPGLDFENDVADEADTKDQATVDKALDKMYRENAGADDQIATEDEAEVLKSMFGFDLSKMEGEIEDAALDASGTIEAEGDLEDPLKMLLGPDYEQDADLGDNEGTNEPVDEETNEIFKEILGLDLNKHEEVKRETDGQLEPDANEITEKIFGMKPGALQGQINIDNEINDGDDAAMRDLFGIDVDKMDENAEIDEALEVEMRNQEADDALDNEMEEQKVKDLADLSGDHEIADEYDGFGEEQDRAAMKKLFGFDPQGMNDEAEEADADLVMKDLFGIDIDKMDENAETDEALDAEMADQESKDALDELNNINDNADAELEKMDGSDIGEDEASDDIINKMFGFNPEEEEKEFDNPLLNFGDEFEDLEDAELGYLDFGGQSNNDWMTSSSGMFLALIVMAIAGYLWKKKNTKTDELYKPRDDKKGIFDQLKNPFGRHGKRDGDDDFDHVV